MAQLKVNEVNIFYFPKHLNFDINYLLRSEYMTQKNSRGSSRFCWRKRVWNVDTNLKILIGGTEIDRVAATGKIEYAPPETEIGERTAK
jgi:hypothetical protein